MVVATKAATFPELLKIREAAALLKIHPKTMRAQIREGRIPYTRHGRRIYVLKDALAQQLRAATAMPKIGGKMK
jgi:excisionase family DNA binding protein